MLGSIGVIWSCASPRRRPGAMGSTMAARFIVPSRAIFPYNCEMFDGACGHTRAWAHTIDR